MGYSIAYDADSKLTISGLACDCPCEHNAPTQDIYVGNGILENLPRYIRKRALGTHCVLVADNNTWEIAGKRAAALLRADGFTVMECVIRREGVMDPDETAVGEVLLSLQPDTEFLVSVGSGSITDIVRVNAKRANLPMVCIGTAPSMDGYTSVVCPLLLRGVKIHRAGNCPDIILCDIDILKTAPLAMVASGVGDVLGKYIAKADWIVGNIVNDEPYCPTCGQIVTDAVNQLVENAEEIRSKSDKGIRVLIEALLLAGMTIMIIGNTRAVASVEHNIAHYWDMVQLSHHKKPPQHGDSVGVATLLVWPIFTRFAREGLPALDLEAIRAKRISREARAQWMLYAYGEEAGNAIMQDNEGDFLSWEEQKRRIERTQARFGEIRACIEALPPFERVRAALQTLGAPLTPQDCGIDRELLNLSMRCAKDYRTRYTLFKTLDECGLLEEYLKDYPVDWKA